MFSKYLTPYLLLNIILFIAFSISVNTFTYLENINIFFYIFFHLTFIYFLFYHFHFTIYFLGLIYGVLLDIFLMNSIGSHLICLISLILFFVLIKRYLFQLSSYQISISIFLTLITIICLEIIFAYFLNNIYFTMSYLFKLLLISIIIFIPSIFILNKLEK